MLFGVRAVVAGGTALLELNKDVLETMRMKRLEVDQALLYAEDQIEKHGPPQIDFILQNEQVENADELKKKNPSLYRLKKFQRAIRRLVLLSRVAKKQGNSDYNIGGLVFELAEQKYDKDSPASWIEVVINHLNMNDLISDTVLNDVNFKIE